MKAFDFHPLDIKDRTRFDQALAAFNGNSLLSAYSFDNIILWRSLYDIFWKEIGQNLCIFFKDKTGCFLYVPPLGKTISDVAVNESFRIMSRMNNNSLVSRIENVPESHINFFKNLGFVITQHDGDYLCKRSELAELTGGKFKKKRAEVRYFIDQHRSEYSSYAPSDKQECLNLFLRWMQERRAKHTDTFYYHLLEDSTRIFEAMLELYPKLHYVGRVVRVNGRICAMTFGYPLHQKCFVILFEVGDLGYRGIAHFIFKTFCQELSQQTINIMDDSGLENLRQTKLSYHPFRMEYNYSIKPA